jgi:hypothetical protein
VPLDVDDELMDDHQRQRVERHRDRARGGRGSEQA